MDQEDGVGDTSSSLTVPPQPLDSDCLTARQRIPTETAFEHSRDDSCITKSHSYTSGFEKKGQNVPKPPPTAMVAPLVGTMPVHTSSSATTTPTRHPKPSRHGLERTNYGISTALSSPSLNRVHEKATLLSPSKSDKQIQSLMNSLSERGQLIERQQLTIARLQQECREKETLLRQFRLQDKKELLVTDPTDITSSSSTAISAPVKIDMLSRKLDALYYELDKKKEEHQMTSTKLKEQENNSSELEARLQDSQHRVKELEEKIDNLRGYLSNTPTMEEHYGLKDELASLTALCSSLKDQVNDREQLVIRLREAIAEKDEELHGKAREIEMISSKYDKLGVRTNSLDAQVHELHAEKSKIKAENQKLQESIGKFDQTLRSELSAMRDRHHIRFRDATAKLREQHKEVVRRNKLLEKQLLKSSDAMTELNTELNLKQGMVGELKSSVNTLVEENQSLLHQNLVLQASHSEAIRSTQSSPADNGLTVKLIQEIALSVDDFSSLVSLLSSMVEGQDPSGSLLLGSKGVTESSTVSLHGLSGEAELQKQLEQVQKLREEIEQLRVNVTERFADQVATDCTVQ